jgi:hypothetical protein
MGSSNFPHNPSAAAAADVPAELEEAEAPPAEELLVLVRNFSLVVSPSPETLQPRKRFLIASKKQQGYTDRFPLISVPGSHHAFAGEKERDICCCCCDSSSHGFLRFCPRTNKASAAAEVGICKRCSVKKKKKNWVFLLV